MKLFIEPLELTAKLSVIWAGIKSLANDSYRYYNREEIIVKTKSGLVKGFKIASNYDYQYFNFLGIPYAKPPIGDLRFKAPQPFEPSNEIINSKFGRRGSMAWQADMLFHQPIGTEDCLHLSVYTHDIEPSQLKPVMVWIHGGAWLSGTIAKEYYNPEFLLRKDIVLIAINYRLGAFGFLSLKDPSLGVPGNAGLKDQVMAMKWIKENCMHFGGDPNNITLFGESAGAASVSMHLLSNQSKDLFHKAILMSGSAFQAWTSPEVESPQKLAKKLGWNGEGGEPACLAFLRKASPKGIVKFQEEIINLEDRKQFQLFPFSPVIEPYESEQCLLNKFPDDIAENAWGKHVPIITGICANEGFIFYKMLKKEPQIKGMDNLKSALIFPEFPVNVDSEECQKLNERFKQFYFDENVKEMPASSPIYGDKPFTYPLYRLLSSREKYHCAPTYLLRFAFESPVIEPYESEQCFLNKYPKDLTEHAWSKHVPILTGICSTEGFIFYKMLKKEPQITQENNLKSALAIQELNTDINSEQSRKMVKQLKHFYFGNIESDGETQMPLMTCILILHDKAFAHAIHRMITARNKNKHATSYLLRFDFESKLGLAKKLFVGEKVPGVCHADDCSYYFRTVSSGDLAEDSDEWKTIERMCETFTTFARVGNPNNALTAPIEWEPVTFESTDQKDYSYKCLNVSKELTYIDWPEFERMTFWDDIYQQYCQNLKS